MVTEHCLRMMIGILPSLVDVLFLVSLMEFATVLAWRKWLVRSSERIGSWLSSVQFRIVLSNRILFQNMENGILEGFLESPFQFLCIRPLQCPNGARFLARVFSRHISAGNMSISFTSSSWLVGLLYSLYRPVFLLYWIVSVSSAVGLQDYLVRWGFFVSLQFFSLLLI